MTAGYHHTHTILAVRGLTVGHDRRPVLSGLDFSLETGRFLCLLGPNGAGKTTLLRTLAGLLPPLAGQVQVDGRPLADLGQAALARVRAVVLTDRLNPGLLTAHEVAALGRHPHTGFFGRLGPTDHRAVERALAMVGASDLAGRYFQELSDGEKQKIVLARALAQEPRLILLDEPTVHLDLKHRLEVMAILRELCRELDIAVVASLHDVDLAARVSDLAALLSGGGLAAFGPPEAVLDEQAVGRLYGLNGARYDRRLGVMELCGGRRRRGPVLVLPGGGTATAALRILHKRDFALTCALAHQGDIDTHVAGALGAELATAPAFGQAVPASLAKARQLLAEAQVVVDGGFPLGEANRDNLTLLTQALELRKPLFSLREPAAARELLGDEAAQDMVFCADELELAARLAAHFHPPVPRPGQAPSPIPA